MPSCAIRAADEFVIFHPSRCVNIEKRDNERNGRTAGRKYIGWKIIFDSSWFFPPFDSYYCSNRIFEIDTENRTKLIRMKLKRKESSEIVKKEEKSIFIKIIFLVRGEKVNWNCIGQIIFFHGRSLFFEKIDFRKCARVYGCRWLSLDFTNLWYMPSALVQKLRYSKNR